METKATRLEKLSRVVRVPSFVRVAKSEVFDVEILPKWEKYIARGVSSWEDQENSSHAGQFITIGPVVRDEVGDAVKKIFYNDSAIEIIVQEYREGLNGVAFCLSHENMYIEYSAQSEGVTAGKVRPFVALLPDKRFDRYVKLQENLLAIYNVFGPSDVEFVGIEESHFVQVRPITSMFEVDTEMVKLKMLLQESIDGKWLENDLAQVIGEHKKSDDGFVFHYMQALTLVYHKYLKKDIRISSDDVICVGSQYFLSEHLVQQTQLGVWNILRFALVFAKEQSHLRDFSSCKNESIETLFEKSILLGMAYTILKKEAFFSVREQYRQIIDPILEGEIGNIQTTLRRFPYSTQLDSVIELNRKTATWQKLQRRDSQGVQVVPGDFDLNAFSFYREGDKIPKGSVVVCDYLYPDIARSIDIISGVICANGSINSHVSILCRERNIPLLIQADIQRFTKEFRG